MVHLLHSNTLVDCVSCIYRLQPKILCSLPSSAPLETSPYYFESLLGIESGRCCCCGKWMSNRWPSEFHFVQCCSSLARPLRSSLCNSPISIPYDLIQWLNYSTSIYNVHVVCSDSRRPFSCHRTGESPPQSKEEILEIRKGRKEEEV